MLMAATVCAFAVEGTVATEIQTLVDTANGDIQVLIDGAIADASAEGLSNKDLMKIIIELKKDTRSISQSAIKDARDMGCKDVHCYLIEVVIGEKNVKIDPLVVGGW